MKAFIQKYRFLIFTLMNVGIPVLVYAAGDFPRRNVLKESLSLLTIIAFALMIGQFFLSRGYRGITQIGKMSDIVTVHKWMGYLFIPVLLLHPLLIVLPRFFEGGVHPVDAFWTMITTWNNPGMVMGIIAWIVMVILGGTSLLRNKWFAGYRNWRWFHGVLSVVFVLLAAGHVVYLGRHSNTVMKWFIVIAVIAAIDILLYTYLTENTKKRGQRKWGQQKESVILAEENFSQ